MDLQQLLALLGGVLSGLVGKYPVIASVIGIIGVARLVMKPIMTAFKAVTEVTPTKADDALYAKIEQNKIYSVVVFVLDWALSIKLPGAAK